MGSRPQNSSNPNHPSDNKDDDDNDTITGAAVAIAAVAGVAALAGWGISKLFGNSEPEPKRQENMLSSSSSSSLAPARDYVYLMPTITKNVEGKPGNNNPMTLGLPKEDKWTKPRPGWYKLNTDGMSSIERGEAAAGGLIRDDEGRWVVGFSARLDYCDITLAELHGLREGLRLAWERELERVEIETDCEAAYFHIEKPDLKLDINRYGSIVEDCRKLMRLDWEIKFSHVDRVKNKCADAMAKRGRFQIERFKIWEEAPPGNVSELVLNERISNYPKYI